MKICYIADGAGLHTQRWLNYIAVKGYEVHLICWKIIPGYNSNIQGEKPHRLPAEGNDREGVTTRLSKKSFPQAWSKKRLASKNRYFWTASYPLYIRWYLANKEIIS